MENNSLHQTPLISLRQAVKTFGYLQALKKVDLDIYQGKSVTIFGPNGAGKSTLLKVLSMQSRLSSGEILYNGTSYKKLSDDFRKNFGIISHQLFLYDNLSVIENLKFYGSLYGIDYPEKKGEELLKQLDIYKRKDDLVRTLSRGMLQRVSIARALIYNPEIIFLDEPYTGLDNHSAQTLSTILKEQLKNNKTIIMVTHEIETGLSFADTVIIMNKGKIVYNQQKSLLDKDKFQELYMMQAC